jgi:hypothetical protein
MIAKYRIIHKIRSIHRRDLSKTKKNRIETDLEKDKYNGLKKIRSASTN